MAVFVLMSPHYGYSEIVIIVILVLFKTLFTNVLSICIITILSLISVWCSVYQCDFYLNKTKWLENLTHNFHIRDYIQLPFQHTFPSE